MSRRFEGKVVIVTGAAGGIGRAAAERFASEGAKVVVVDRVGSPLAETVSAVQRAGGEALAVEADVSKGAEVERYVREAVARFGGIDVLFNNAGILGSMAAITEYPEEMFDRVLGVNAKGVWLGIKTVAPIMRERGGGAIVNTASTAAQGAAPGLVAYSASKHAVIGITKTAAVELAPQGIRVNCICPGPIETGMMREAERGVNPDHPEQERGAWAEAVPLKRYGQPAEIAAMAAFLASEEASYITGAVHNVDGGLMSQQK